MEGCGSQAMRSPYKVRFASITPTKNHSDPGCQDRHAHKDGKSEILPTGRDRAPPLHTRMRQYQMKISPLISH